MQRNATAFIMLAMCLATTVMAATVSTTSTLATSEHNTLNTVADESSTAALKRDKRTFGLDLPLDLGSIINAVKDQIRDVIIEIGLHIGKYILNIFHDCKIRLLKKLGKYALSDVFRLVFDGVGDFISKAAPILSDDFEVVEPVEVVEAPIPSFRPYAFNPRLAPFY